MIDADSPAGTDPAEDLVSEGTRTAEEDEAGKYSIKATVHGGADRPPTDEEALRAEEAAASADPSVGEHFKEMDEIGAKVKGEGEIGG